MSDVWSTRADAFRTSEPHRAGEDLDLVVEWCEPDEGAKVLDVATGGGHVARRLRDAGCEVVTVDPAPGMRPDVVARAEDLPFADGSFDVVVCRIAAHHFPDVEAAVAEMARVSQRLLVVDDLLFDGEGVDEAHRLRDPTHVRSYTADEWRELLGANGFEVEQVEVLGGRRLALEPWLDRVEVPAADRPRILELLGDAADGETVRMPLVVLQARKSQR
ncbi:MAG TPA: class I SAM-dependent methyltransferase [Gaiellaceae bacterium]|nr:class I SAM-dependent methyltransferase [Gaiellaceae bacterium]